MILRLASILSTMCLLYAATGCGESPKPIPLGSESTKPTASSPSSAVPSLPPEARQKNEAGVKATVEAFVAAWNLAAGTGETTMLKNLSTSSCLKCIGAARAAEKTYSSGGRFEDSDWRISQFNFKGIEGNTAFVELLIDVAASSYYPDASSSPESYPEVVGEIHFLQLEWNQEHHWRISMLDPKP